MNGFFTKHSNLLLFSKGTISSLLFLNTYEELHNPKHIQNLLQLSFVEALKKKNISNPEDVLNKFLKGDPVQEPVKHIIENWSK